MVKANPVYHSQPFRILRRTETNAVIVPLGLGYLKKRFKYEGDIPKNLCTLQRLSNLKPIKNPFKLLKLSFSQKIILELNSFYLPLKATIITKMQKYAEIFKKTVIQI